MTDLVDLLPGSGVDDDDAAESFWAEIDRQGTVVTTTTTTTTTNTVVLGVLPTVALADVEPVEAVQITTTGTLTKPRPPDDTAESVYPMVRPDGRRMLRRDRHGWFRGCHVQP